MVYHRPRGTWCFHFDPRLYSISSIRGRFSISVSFHLYVSICTRCVLWTIQSKFVLLSSLGLLSSKTDDDDWCSQSPHITISEIDKNSVIDSHNLRFRNVKVHNAKHTHNCIVCSDRIWFNINKPQWHCSTVKKNVDFCRKSIWLSCIEYTKKY